jgi:hypothetical protein
VARTLKLSATYNLGAGDGVSAETQSANASLSSGLSTMIAGSAPTAGKEYVVADFLGSANKAKGLYFENTDSTNYITLHCGTGTGTSDVCNLRVKAGGVVMFHDDTDAITHIKVTANTAAASFVLSFCE